VAGLPGAPVRAAQVGVVYNIASGGGGQAMTIAGRPPMLSLPLGALDLPGAFGQTDALLPDQLRLLAVHAFVGAGNSIGTPAQQAVQAALLTAPAFRSPRSPRRCPTPGCPSWAQAAGNGEPGPAKGPVYDAARRLAAMPAVARHAWLFTHLAALRSGQLTLAQLP
jgi:hypothetical protein